MASADEGTATEMERGSNVPSESARPSHNHIPSYATMSQAYGPLGHLPFVAQQGCIMPAEYTSAMPRIEGLQDLAAYQSNVNAQMAQYQVRTSERRAIYGNRSHWLIHRPFLLIQPGSF